MKTRKPTTDRPKAVVRVTTTLLLFSAVWLSIFGSTVRCQTILVPSRLHVGEKNTLLLISESSEEDSSATLRLFNKGFTHGTPLLSQEVHFKKGQQLSEVPLLLDNGQLAGQTQAIKEQVTVEVIFSGSGAKASEDVEVSPGHGFVFLQTDKPIYRVSETVRFRVLRLDRRLSPLNETVVLKIANHQKIKVEEVVLVTEPPMHIAEHRFNFPLIAKPGTWMADLFYGPKHKLVVSTSFDVTEYILPTFKIDFSMPSFILNTDETIQITMRVNYTFGKPVRGTVHYRYGLMDAVPTGTADGTGGQQQQRMSKILGSSNPFCFDGGVMTHRASLGFLKSYTFPVRFVVEATVKECASNVLEKASDSSVLVVERPYTVALRKTIRRYKPNVSNFVTLEILDPHRQPVPGVPFTVEIKSTDLKNPVTLHPYIVSSTYDTATGRADPKTDAEGRVIFNFKTSDNTRSYNVRLATKDPRYSDLQQTFITFAIEPFNGTGEPASLWIENKRELTYRVGDRFQSHIATAGKLAGETVHLLVLSKGTVILRETLQGPNNRSIDFEISNRMVPTVRLLVVATSAEEPKGVLVADSLRLSVAPGPRCGVEVTMLGPKDSHTILTQKKKKILPGGNVTFSVAGGRAGDVVGFHAIDEAIYVLRAGGRNASRNAYARALEVSDAGCGPGGGATSLEVVRTAGFKALSAVAPVHGRTDDSVCKRLVRRKRSSPSFPSISAVATEAVLEQCCKWAYLKSKLTMSCKTRSDIVRQHTKSAACAQRYHECCLMVGNRKFQASASMNKNTNTKAAAAAPPETELIDSGGVDADLVRTDFRDTWLFDLKLLDSSGQQNFTFPTPHSITSWAVSTLSITERAGFCLSATADHMVTTFKPFFIKVSFPPTIIEHEQTEVVVTVFNYNSGSRLSVRITFDKVDGICSDWLGAKRAVRNVQVNPSSSERTAFSIVPIYKGTHEIRIEAKSIDFTDTVVRTLTVLPPGIEREQQLSFDLDPLNRAKRETRVEGDFYTDVTTNSSQQTKVELRRNSSRGGDWVTTQANVVPKTLHYVVTAVGERFTPQLGSIEELSALIRKPKGCGEQNMYYMAFNLYSLRYLEQIGRLTERTKRRGVAYLQRALQQQLDFRKTDGSYAAFSKRASSVWLTGFVAKIVCQSAPYLESQLDERVVETALRWLSNRQQANGAWKEEYPLLHEKALGGTDNTYGLTAYLMIVFHECRPYLNRFAEFSAGGEQQQKGSSSPSSATMNLNRTIELAEKYLVARYNAKIDGKKSGSDSLRYRQALVAYALTFSSSPKAATLRHSLTKSLAASSTTDPRRNQQWWADALWPVETAAYALMAFIAPDLSDPQAPPVDILSHLSIVNWLNSQQKRGTFDNTQDTIVALDALAKYYVLYAKRYDADEADRTGRGSSNGGSSQQKRLHHELQTDVSFNNRLKRSLLFHNANADLLQTLQVDSDTREIDLKTTGTGLGKLNLLIIYNEFAPNGSCRYDLNVDVYVWLEEDAAKGDGGGSHVNHHEFDDNIFDTPEKKDTMFYELGVNDGASNNKGRKLVDLPVSGVHHQGVNISAVVNCCQDTRLVSKRSIFPTAYFGTNYRRKPSSWKAVADSLRAEEERRQKGGQSSFATVGTSKRSADQNKKSSTKRQQSSQRHAPGPVAKKSFAPLPHLATELEHPIVLVLNICSRYYLTSYNSDMAILEVSILSGFRPVQTDLEAIFSDSSAALHGGYIAHYDVSPSKVIFYFREVPSYFNQCIAFRIYQQHRVEKTQSALVRMYNYYEQEMVCSRLYTNVRQTDYIALKCDRNQNEAEKCRCVTNLRCPGSSVVDTILKSNRDFRDMEYLFCQHTHIIIGTIVSITNERNNATGPSYEDSPVMTIKVDEERGNITSGDIKPTGKDTESRNNSTVVLYFNTECGLYVTHFKTKRSQRVIVMHNPNRDSRWLVDGNSVLKILNEADYTEMTYFIDQARLRGALTNCNTSSTQPKN